MKSHLCTAMKMVQKEKLQTICVKKRRKKNESNMSEQY